MLLTLGVGFSCWILVCGVILGIPSLASTMLLKGELVTLLLLCCGCLCSVTLPHGAVG